MNADHEIRVDGDRAWCETCSWSDVTHGYYSARLRAFLHFSDPAQPERDARGGPAPSWVVCEFCSWPDRVWPAGRPDGDLGVTRWPRHATWRWDIRGRSQDWVLACDEHEHLGPRSDSHAYKHLVRSA